MKVIFSRLRQLILAHKIVTSGIAAVCVLVIAGGVAWFVFFTHKTPAVHHTTSTQPVATPTPMPPSAPKYYSTLTGVEVGSQATTTEQVRAVMIDNTPQARPQSGTKEAGVVFEADADGGITRFLALYQEGHPSLIGPIRSVRPYFVDWLAAFDASVSHVGGSALALQEVRNGSFKDLDEFFNGDTYWRATDRYAPHNVYTSTSKIAALNAQKGYSSSSFTGFPRKDDAPPVSPNATSIDITVSDADYHVHYDYDKLSNSYIRYDGGAKQVDREEGQLMPKVVIAIKVPTKVSLEDGYRVDMQTIGTGTAYVFQDGTVTVGTWTKSAQKSQITFADSAGKLISLNRGQTWITVTAPDETVTWK